MMMTHSHCINIRLLIRYQCW